MVCHEPRPPGESRQARYVVAWLGLMGLVGCAAPRPVLDQALLARPIIPAAQQPAAEPYRVGCPDVLAVTIADTQAVYTLHLPIGPDGRVNLGEEGRLRVEGQTLEEVAQQLSTRLGVSQQQLRVAVTEFKSQRVYLFGEVSSLQRAVPYRGPETVTELLHRVGGLTTGGDPNDVFVIRARVAAGSRPEVVRVDLRGIVLNQDPQTNVLLEPSDQVYVGESRQSTFGKSVPPSLRPFYDRFCGWWRRTAAPWPR